MTILDCPHCGRPGRTTKDIPPGARIKCPACQKSFTPKPATEGRGITIDVTPTRAEASPESRPVVAAQEVPRPEWVAPVASYSPPAPMARPSTVISPVPAHATPSVVPEPSSSARVPCYFCGEEVLATAKKCKHCGEFLDLAMRDRERAVAAPVAPQVVIHNSSTSVAAVVGLGVAPRWNRGVAALLSLAIPGAGQLYKGQPLNGIAWLFFTILGYFCYIVPGLIVHACCVIGAASGDPRR